MDTLRHIGSGDDAIHFGFFGKVPPSKVYIELQSLEQRFRQHKGYRRESTQAKFVCGDVAMRRNSLVLFSLYCGLVHWNGVPGEGASCKRRSRGNSEPVHSFNQCFQRCFLFALFCLISISNILSTRRQQLWCSGRTELHLALVWFFVSASPVLIVLLLPVRYSSSASFKFLEAFSFLRQHPLGKRAGRVLSQGLGETSRNFLFLCRNRK